MIHREDAESIALVQWCEWRPELRGRLVHSPNGGKRNAREAARFKRMGVRAGYPDFSLDIAHGRYHGLRIELKPPRPHKSKVSDSQKWWIETLSNEGYLAVVCYGWEAARDTIISYMESGNANRP